MILKIDHLEKKYDNFQLNCSLEVKEGMVSGIIGANGAGKSTTFKALLDLIRIDGGQIELFGKPYNKLSLTDKERLGVVLAEACFSGSLTIGKVIPVMESMYHAFDKPWFLQKCEAFGLPLDKKIKDMSTGMRAKLKLLLAISHNAQLLILDEPTSGLDVLTRDEMLGLLREYMEVEGRAILISSHISSDLENFCDDIYMLKEGKIIFHEDTDVLLSDYAVLKVDEKQYASMDRSRILYKLKESYGYMLLTNQKQFYMDNYPQIVVENGSIDEIMTMMSKGERV